MFFEALVGGSLACLQGIKWFYHHRVSVNVQPDNENVGHLRVRVRVAVLVRERVVTFLRALAFFTSSGFQVGMQSIVWFG